MEEGCLALRICANIALGAPARKLRSRHQGRSQDLIRSFFCQSLGSTEIEGTLVVDRNPAAQKFLKKRDVE